MKVKVMTSGRTLHIAQLGNDETNRAVGDSVNNTLITLLEQLGVLTPTGQPHPDIRTYELNLNVNLPSD